MRGIAPELLRAAAEVVASRGLRSASLTEIAARAGVSRATAYRAFGDQDAMLVAVLTDELDRGLQVIEKRVADVSCGRELVRTWLDHTIDLARRSPVYHRVLSTEAELVLRLLMARIDGQSLISHATAQTAESLQRLGAEDLFTLPVANVAEVLVRTSFSVLLEPATTMESREVAVSVICAATGANG